MAFRTGTENVLLSLSILNKLNLSLIILYLQIVFNHRCVVYVSESWCNSSSDYSHVSMLFSSSVNVTPGFSYDLSMAARKLSLQPRPLTMRELCLLTLISLFSAASATAVWRLSRELDFFRPSEGPTSSVLPTIKKKRLVSEATRLTSN